MTTNMVRKQIYIHQRQEIRLKQLAEARGVSEAEIIRRALERELGGEIPRPVPADRSAWQELTAFLEARHATTKGRQPYRWNRQEIYDERENRWLRDRKEEE